LKDSLTSKSGIYRLD